jgi:antitoxin MazE
MRRNVQRWGNSLAVRIPAAIAAECGLAAGTPIDVETEGTRVVLVPRLASSKKHDLRQLVARITPRNRPAPVNFGKRTGREFW